MNVPHPIYGLLTQISNLTERMSAIVQITSKHLSKLDKTPGYENFTKATEYARLEHLIKETTKVVHGNTTTVYTQLIAHQRLSDICEWQLRKELAFAIADRTRATDKSKFQAILNAMSVYGMKKEVKVKDSIQVPIIFSIPPKIKLTHRICLIKTPLDFYRQCRGRFRVTRSYDALLGPSDKPRWRIIASAESNSTHFDPKFLAIKRRVFGPFKAGDPLLQIYQQRIPHIEFFYRVLEQRRSWFRQPLLVISSSVTFENIHFSGQLFLTKPSLNSVKKKLNSIAITFINCSFGTIRHIPNTSFWDKLVAKTRAKLQKADLSNKRAIEQQLAMFMGIREYVSGKYGSFLKASHSQVHVFGSAVVIFKDCHFGPNSGPGVVAESSSDVVVDGCVFRGHGMSYLAVSSVELPRTAAVVCRGVSTLIVQNSLFFYCHCGVASFGENFCSDNKTMTGKDYLINGFSSELKFNTLSPFHQEFMDYYYKNPEGIKELLIGASLITDDDLSDCKIKTVSQCLFQYCAISIATYGDYKYALTVTDCSITSPLLEISRKVVTTALPTRPISTQPASSNENDEWISAQLNSIVTGVQGMGSAVYLQRLVFSDPEKSCLTFYECNVSIKDCYCASPKLYADDMINSDLLEYSNFIHLRGKIAPFILSDKTMAIPTPLLRILLTKLKQSQKQEVSKKNLLLKYFHRIDVSSLEYERAEAPHTAIMGISLTKTTGTISNVLIVSEVFWHGLHFNNSAVLVNNVALSNCNDGIFIQSSEVFLNHIIISQQRRSACIAYGTTIYIDGQTNITGAGRMAIGAFQSDVYLQNSTLRDSVTGIRLIDSSSLIASKVSISLMERGIVISSTSAHAIKDVTFSDNGIDVSIV